MTIWTEKDCLGRDGASIILENVAAIEFKPALLDKDQAYTFDNRELNPITNKPNAWNDMLVINGSVYIAGDDNIEAFYSAWEEFSGVDLRNK